MERILGSRIFLEDAYPAFLSRLLTYRHLGDSSVYDLYFLACLDLHHVVADFLRSAIQLLRERGWRNEPVVVRGVVVGYAGSRSDHRWCGEVDVDTQQGHFR